MEINFFRYPLVFLMIVFALPSISQTNNLSKTRSAFLLGMFNDYLGKQFVPNHPTESQFVTSFYASESSVTTVFLDSLKLFSGGDSSKIVLKKEGVENPILKIYSEKYSKYFNTYYNFKKSEGFGYFDDRDSINRGDFEIYIGKLNSKKIKGNNEKLSYLAGSFLRNGKMNNDGAYKFQFGNSISKYKIVRKFLMDTKSRILFKKVKKDRIPVISVIEFVPSKALKQVLERLPPCP